MTMTRRPTRTIGFRWMVWKDIGKGPTFLLLRPRRRSMCARRMWRPSPSPGCCGYSATDRRPPSRESRGPPAPAHPPARRFETRRAPAGPRVNAGVDPATTYRARQAGCARPERRSAMPQQPRRSAPDIRSASVRRAGAVRSDLRNRPPDRLRSERRAPSDSLPHSPRRRLPPNKRRTTSVTAFAQGQRW